MPSCCVGRGEFLIESGMIVGRSITALMCLYCPGQSGVNVDTFGGAVGGPEAGKREPDTTTPGGSDSGDRTDKARLGVRKDKGANNIEVNDSQGYGVGSRWFMSAARGKKKQLRVARTPSNRMAIREGERRLLFSMRTPQHACLPVTCRRRTARQPARGWIGVEWGRMRSRIHVLGAC